MFNYNNRTWSKVSTEDLETADQLAYDAFVEYPTLLDLHNTIDVDIVSDAGSSNPRKRVPRKLTPEEIDRIVREAELTYKANEERNERIRDKMRSVRDNWQRLQQLEREMRFSPSPEQVRRQLESGSYGTKRLGYYTRVDNKGKVVLENSFNDMLSTYLHEMHHAYFDHDKSKPKTDVAFAEEPIAEFGMLCALEQLQWKDSKFEYEKNNAIRNMRDYRYNPDLTHYAFGLYLYEKWREINWVQLMHDAKYEIDTSSALYQQLMGYLDGVYPYDKEKEVAECLYELLTTANGHPGKLSKKRASSTSSTSSRNSKSSAAAGAGSSKVYADDPYNPDVLNCIANLSNDEVFTSPALANQVLDMLPQELFQSPDTTFLDPFTKSGVFLREIVKRLDRGLADKIPNRQKRIDHIMHHQVYGIALTELTSLLSRRTLYCSKRANSVHSVSYFDDEQGHVLYKALRHTWVNGKCQYCGASQGIYDRGDQAEQYAYQFLHTDKPETIFNMKFDVIIGNPPYQLSDGGAQASATPIYDQFVEQAKKLNPRYLAMIIPARWYGGGKGLDLFRSTMIADKRIRILHDFLNAASCFPGVEIKGGVCYFLWDRDHKGVCQIFTHTETEIIEQKPRYLQEKGSDVFIRYEEGVSAYHKVQDFMEQTMESLVSPQKPFGLRTFVQGKDQPFDKCVTLFQNGGIGYIKRSEIERNDSLVDTHKVFISRAYNAGDNYPHQIIGKPLYGAPNSCCTETYVMIGPFSSESEAKNVISYISTRFFRYMVFLSKVSQMASAKVYQFVPIQDFSHPWTDDMLYKKYNFDAKEIAFIESMIRPME